MRVQSNKVAFEPVTITLETQFEVDVIWQLTRRIGGLGKVRKLTDSLGISLEKYADEETEEYFTDHVGSIE